ncbi:MAG: putative quinol monooxygenase [Lentisphaeria bacterium]
MIRVIATITLKPGCRERFLAHLRRNLPNVKAEPGCLDYTPMLDIASGLPPQIPPRPDVVTIVEAWESLEALKLHLSGLPHMVAYKAATQELVAGVSLQVLAPA